MTILKKITGIRLLGMVILAAAIFSCKTAEKVAEVKIRPMSPGRLLKKVEENTFDYQRLDIKRINCQIDNGDSKTSFRASLKSIKDRDILLTFSKLNILVGRVLLTPDSVWYVNYLERKYFAGDYSGLSQLFNLDLDFNTIQSIISNRAFTFNEDDDFESGVEDGMYMLQSEKVKKLSRIGMKGKPQRMERLMKRLDEDALVMQTMFIDPVRFVLRKMQVQDKTNNRQVEFLFNDFEQVNHRDYPTSLDMSFRSPDNFIRLNVKMSGFSTEETDSVTLKIPEKFTQVYLN